VREINYKKTKIGGTVTTLEFEDGASRSFEGIHEPPPTVIPAQPGYVLAVAWMPSNNEKLDCPDEQYDFNNCISFYSIVAWKMEDTYPTPLTVNGDSNGNQYENFHGIVDPSGKVIIVEDREFESVDAWKAHVRSEWLQRRQKAKLKLAKTAEPPQ
jgi:hypothetical protein